MNARGIVLAAALLALAACAKSDDPGYQGWVEADLIFVSPDEAGRVDTLSVREGDTVEMGAALFAVDPELQQADVDMATAAVTNATLAFERAQTLLKSSAGTQKTLEDAEATLRTARARLNSAQTRLARRKMASPVNGSVQQIYYRPGEIGAGRAAGGVAAAAGQHQSQVLRAGNSAAKGGARRGGDDPLRRLQIRR